MKPLHIRNEWYGAWKEFGWPEGTRGVGIKKALVMRHLRERKPILLQLYKDKQIYEVSPVTVNNYVKKHSTTYTARRQTVLYVIPRDLLKKYKPKKKVYVFDKERQIYIETYE